MTLVIAEKEAGRVIMGADSAAGNREEIHTVPDLEKIVLRGPYLVGHCGNGRVGQVVNLLVEWPEPPRSGELLPFLVREVVPEIRRAVQDAGAAQEGPAILGATTVLLIGLNGQLFVVARDLNVIISPGTACIGSGRHHGDAAMHALTAAKIEPARKRIEMALQAAADNSLYVRPPFRILETAENPKPDR